MKALALSLAFFSVLSLSGMAGYRDDLEPVGKELAQKDGKQLSDEAAKFEKPQVKVEADPEKANGVHVPAKVGVLVVPQKGLEPNEELAAKFKTDRGASLAFLFLYNITPVIDGKPVDGSQLRSVKLTDDSGTEHTVHVLLLAVRQLADEDYRLHAYGHEDKPLVEARFSEGSPGQVPEPVAVDIKDPNVSTHQGKLVITVFGKYQASFTVGHKAQ